MFVEYCPSMKKQREREISLQESPESLNQSAFFSNKEQIENIGFLNTSRVFQMNCAQVKGKIIQFLKKNPNFVALYCPVCSAEQIYKPHTWKMVCEILMTWFFFGFNVHAEVGGFSKSSSNK